MTDDPESNDPLLNERGKICDDLVRVFYGELTGDFTGGDYAQLFTVAYDPGDESWVCVFGSRVYYGQYVDDEIWWDIVGKLSTTMTSFRTRNHRNG